MFSCGWRRKVNSDIVNGKVKQYATLEAGSKGLLHCFADQESHARWLCTSSTRGKGEHMLTPQCFITFSAVNFSWVFRGQCLLIEPSHFFSASSASKPGLKTSNKSNAMFSGQHLSWYLSCFALSSCMLGSYLYTSLFYIPSSNEQGT